MDKKKSLSTKKEMKQNYKMHTERVKKSIDHEKGSDNTAATTKMPNDRSFS
jgi:hypothetical protein